MATANRIRVPELVRVLVTMGSVAAATLAAVAAAHAAELPFLAGSPPWLSPGSVRGVVIHTATIWVDTNMDGSENGGDHHHPIPALLDGTWDAELSPTMRIMVATRHSGGDCSGGTTDIRVFAIPQADQLPLTELGTKQTLAGCLANPNFYFDPDTLSPYRTVLFREVGSTSYNPYYLWWNLVGGSFARSQFPYLHSTGFIEFAPTGTMAYVQHDVNGTNGTNYSLVSLCPARIGQASVPGAESDTVLHAFLVTGSPNTVVFRSASGASHGSAPYDDCITSIPIGACCKPDGSCSDTTQAGCTGIWHPEGLCATVQCPSASLHVAMTGPASAERGALVTYTLTASNTGQLASNSVVVTDVIPTGSTFVSATAGGTFSAANSRVTWNLGTLAGGQQVALGLTVRAQCGGTSMFNSNYSIAGSPGGAVGGTPFVTTTLTNPSAAGLTMTLLSSALDPTPLQTGGRTRHTIRMTNSLATPRTGLGFNVNSGSLTTMLQVVNNGGGQATLGSTNLVWSGDLPASSTTDVVYDTQVRECRPSLPGTERINNGNVVFLNNICSFPLVYVMPTQSIAVAPSPFSLRLDSPSHGPAQGWDATGDYKMVVCRPGDAVDVDLMVINQSGSQSPSANASLTLPPELPAATDPPFVGTPPAGATWDPGTRQISWTGQIPANDTVRITFRVAQQSGECSGDLFATGGFGSCANYLHADLAVLAVPQPPTSHLLALHTYDGLWYSDASGQNWQPLLCGTFESLRGFGRTPDGNIWVAGVPSFRLNPYQLSFEVFPPSFIASLGMDWPYDAAGDPRDSTVVFGGYLSGYGLRLRRYDPRTHNVSVILNDTSPMTLGLARHVTVSDSGLIGVNTNSGILRVDPANPAVHPLFAPPGGGSITGLTLDTDGDWLTSRRPTGSGAPRDLVKVNRDTGAYSSIVDMQSFFTWYVQMPAIATTPQLDVFLASEDAVFGRVRRGAGNAITTSIVPVNITDLMWIGPATGAVDPPAPRDAPVTFGLASPRPNPARGDVELGFSLPAAGPASLAVYDVVGRRVRTLAEGSFPAGRHAFNWDGVSDAGSRASAGLYFVKLVTPAGERVAKLVRMK